jgi:hypothetical protein
MIRKLFVIRDNKSKAYHEPHIYTNKADAMRAVTLSVNSDNKQNLFCTNPEDFSLFEIGEWNPVEGIVAGMDKNHVCDLIDLVKID